MRDLCEASEDEKTLLQYETDATRGIQSEILALPSYYNAAAEINESTASPCPKAPSSKQNTLPPIIVHAPTTRPCLLVPKITVTSDSTRLYEGQKHLWAAIEVTGQVRPASLGIVDADTQQPKDCSFEFGCLYDLAVEVLPAAETSVAQIIGHQAFPANIYPGSSVLLLVRMNLNGGLLSPRRHTHTRQRSDELIEDLENQLGDAPVGYMEIHMSYSHPAFTHYVGPEATAGISSVHSRVQTTAIATLKRHNALSPWSQRPASVPDQLLRVMERHWGVEKATEVIRKILSSYTTPRKPMMTRPESPLDRSNLSEMQSIASASPRVPIRQASLATDTALRAPTPIKGYWADVRRAALGSTPALQPIHGNTSVSDIGSGVRKTSQRASSRASKRGEDKGVRCGKDGVFIYPSS
ncbi:hypothetical protein PT974_00881 [Cladobotryum mycophilum]|uniref:Uncharacterized protein n=1 Tax=Cladobotryum mycophilum TaxID=491253 RepID=A0ABR0T249_9HYPO